MNYFKLAYTTPDVLDKIKAAEARGDFNAHLDAIDYDMCLPVDESFPYIPAGRLKIRQALIRAFIISPFMWIVNRFIFRTRVYIDKSENDKNLTNFAGKQHKNRVGFIVTCNHINKLDALVVLWALKRGGLLRGRRLKVMVADFNNQKGRLGEYMRAFGIMPFPSGHRLVRRFNEAVSYYLKKGDCILIFPEQSEWWGYDRPRPLKSGAFYYAVKNNVSVQPLFIKCRDSGRTKNGVERKYFDVHIAEQIPVGGEDVSDHERIRLMKEENERIWKKFSKNSTQVLEI